MNGFFIQLRPLGHRFMTNRPKGFAANLAGTPYSSSEKRGSLKAPPHQSTPANRISSL